jgi:hypothetical protein
MQFEGSINGTTKIEDDGTILKIIIDYFQLYKLCAAEKLI